MIVDPAALLIAFSIGVLGGAHCIGMCGGIMGALTVAIDQHSLRRLSIIGMYNIGRITSYVLIAALFFSVFSTVDQYFALQVMRWLAGVLLIAMGLYLANWWRGLVYLEKAGHRLWQYIQPSTRRLLPVKTLPQAWLLGMLWGWLPCGLIYSALVYSATAPSIVGAMLTMFAFAMGTLPAVLMTGVLASQLTAMLNHRLTRQSFAVLLIIFGLWTLAQAAGHAH